MDVKLLGSLDQYLHCEVFNTNGKSHWLIIIYTQNQLMNKKNL